jgi:5-methylcytosine-specific restriction endonuclease McrA
MPRIEFSKSVKRAAWDRAGGRCEASGVLYGLPETVVCGRDLRHGVEYDHVLADSNGGAASLENCAAVCPRCHAYKSREVDTPRAAKSVRQGDKHRGIKSGGPSMRSRGFRRAEPNVKRLNEDIA